MDDQDWYEATIIDNSSLGDAFIINDICVYRRYEKSRKKLFEIFNLRDTTKLVTGEEAKQQLRASRDSHNNVVRAKDQGYINWKYSS
jgi:hypothetical protein